MISLLITLVIICVVGALLWWLLQLVPIPEPARKFVNVLFIVILVLAVIFEVLLPLAHVGSTAWR